MLRQDDIGGDAEERASWVVGCRCVLERYAEVYRAAAEMYRFEAIEVDRLQVDEGGECVGCQVCDLHFCRGGVGAEVGEARWGEAVTSRVNGCVNVQFGMSRGIKSAFDPGETFLILSAVLERGLDADQLSEKYVVCNSLDFGCE